MKISTFTESEGEITFNFLSKDEVFGDLLVFSSFPNYPGIAECLENTSISYISKNKLMELFQLDNIFLAEFLTLITNKGVVLKQKNKLFAHKNIEERFFIVSFNNNIKCILFFNFNIHLHFSFYYIIYIKLR